MKRLTIFVLSLIILIPLSLCSFSADAPTIEVGSVTAEAGTVVEVPVSFTGNPGICSFTLAFTYDPDVLTLESVKPSDEIGGNFAFGERAVWIASGDVKADGVFLTLRFKIDHYVEAKDYSVGVVYNKGDICNYNEDDVDFETVSGRITVERAESFPVEDPETSAPVEVTSGETEEEGDDATSDAATSDFLTSESAGADPDIEEIRGGDTDIVSSPDYDTASAHARELFDSKDPAAIASAVEKALEEVGAGNIAEIPDSKKSDFIDSVAKELGFDEADREKLNDDELLYGIDSAYESAVDKTASSEKGGADTPDTETAKDSKSGGNSVLIAALCACAVAAVTVIIIISKKSKNLRK